MMIGKFLLFIIALLISNFLFGQYTLNGSASQNDCHCYTLTNDAFSQSGSVWNNNKINLTQSFDFKFNVFLGCADAAGADGIAFVLQPISTSVGTVGGGLGYSGVTPAVGVTIDTWQNGSPTTSGPDGDPSFDHIAIQLNGDLNHKDSIAPQPINNIAGPVTALSGNDNIEDCQWHILRIHWDEPTKTLSAYVDGILRVSAIKDITKDVFGGNALVFWGFTGSTGGAKNLQQMCTALKPLFNILPNQKRCIGELITFYDSTISFSTVQKIYWDFGDGSPVDSVNTNPVHAYIAAGNYTVVQKVLGADGCTEINSQQIIIGSKPMADFTFNNACVLDSLVNFRNTSTASFGTINQWFWDFGNGETGSTKDPSKIFTTPGFKRVKLAVKSAEGCESDTTSHVVLIYRKPNVDFSFTDNQCLNAVVQFNDLSVANDGIIESWRWNLDSANNKIVYIQNPTYAYSLPGQHLVSLVTKTTNGCVGNIVIKPVNILPKPVAAFSNPPICLSVPVTFTDSSYITGAATVDSWWWDLGNGTNSINKNPTTSYQSPGDINIQLVAKTENGCVSDTLKKLINIESKPTANFGYSLPVCESKPLLLLDSSVIDSGTIQGWYWNFDNGTSAFTKNVTAIFTNGSHQVKLVVQNGKGCNSDTTVKTIIVNPRPVIDFTVENACKNTNVSFSGLNLSGESIATWQWNFDDGSIVYSKDAVHLYAATGSFPIKLFAVSQAGCFSDTVQRNITIYTTNAFAGNDTTAASNQPLQLMGSGGVSYEWFPALGLSNPFISNPIAVNNMDISYVLKAFTPLGCESYDTIRIKIYDGPEIYVPGAFTPNGDGLNDLLKAIPAGIRQFKNFTVYNRLGQVVFTTTEPASGWDGLFKGKAQNPGTFIWIASATDYLGNEIFRKGKVILVR